MPVGCQMPGVLSKGRFKWVGQGGAPEGTVVPTALFLCLCECEIVLALTSAKEVYL